MSEFKGTPGPWSVMDGHYPCMKEIAGPSFKVSIVMSATDIGINEYMRRSADAHLIAAAPELLEALEGIMRVEARDRVMPVGVEWDAARAAIRKALGEE